jgi:hypothetical protein
LSAKIDLKDIERRAYTSYHEDGIIDIFIGLGLLSTSFYVYAEMAWLMGSFVAGAVGAGVFAVVGYLTDLTRFYRYAAATLVVLGSAYFIPIPFIAHVAVLGAIIGAAGYLQLESFKRRYPLMEEN